MNDTPTETLTVLYDGACPLCQREIAHVRGLTERHHCALRFVDISPGAVAVGVSDDERAALMARFHVCLLYTSPSPRDLSTSRMPSSA